MDYPCGNLPLLMAVSYSYRLLSVYVGSSSCSYFKDNNNNADDGPKGQKLVEELPFKEATNTYLNE